ncbi:MAG: hypothetical protein AAGA54_00640, partial [Myxococcota bacterium]
ADEFVDGWSVTFEHFVVSLDAIDMRGEALEGGFVVDLVEDSGGRGHALGELQVPAGGAPVVSYALTPASANAATDVADATLDAMVAQGSSVWVRGTAQRDGVTKTFDWSFDADARYSACETTEVLRVGEAVDVTLTLHADHLFYDDLDSEEPGVAFDLIADADADADGSVSQDELRAQSIAGQVRYQVGTRDMDDLNSFIAAQVRTLGHINGEGHCEID